jgi:hypothetical protein
VFTKTVFSASERFDSDLSKWTRRIMSFVCQKMFTSGEKRVAEFSDAKEANNDFTISRQLLRIRTRLAILQYLFERKRLALGVTPLENNDVDDVMHYL